MKRVFGLVFVMLLVTGSAAFAFDNNFSTTDLGYELYDLVVNKGLNGVPGWIVCSLLVGGGLYNFSKGQLAPAFMGIGSGMLIKGIPGIMGTMGCGLEVIGYISTIGTLIW